MLKTECLSLFKNIISMTLIFGAVQKINSNINCNFCEILQQEIWVDKSVVYIGNWKGLFSKTFR